MAFRVPEQARLLTGEMGTARNAGNYGAFRVPSPESGWQLNIIATDGDDPDVPEAQDWEHVSVTADQPKRARTPTWREMTFVKSLFWDEEDVVVQFHPRRSEYVNVHPYVLHLWRYTRGEFPTPPPSLVG